MAAEKTVKSKKVLIPNYGVVDFSASSRSCNRHKYWTFPQPFSVDESPLTLKGKLSMGLEWKFQNKSRFEYWCRERIERLRCCLWKSMVKEVKSRPSHGGSIFKTDVYVSVTWITKSILCNTYNALLPLIWKMVGSGLKWASKFCLVMILAVQKTYLTAIYRETI